MKRIAIATLILATSLHVFGQARGAAGPAAGGPVQGARGGPAGPRGGRTAAPFDLTGYWVSVVGEDWRWRMYPTKGDYGAVPLNAAARRIADAWDPAKDAAAGEDCKAFAAPVVMRIPGRLHITYGPRANATLRNDPMGACDPLGIPRNLNAEVVSSHNWWEVIQTSDRVIQFFEWHHEYRVIYTDGRKLPAVTADLDPKWNGYSVGRWEGDTFVVDSVGFDERTWLDKFGYAHSDQMKLQERYRRVDADTLELTMVVTDPQYYTKPWESDRKVFKLNAFQFEKPWDEPIYCVPSEENKFNRLIRDPASGK